MSSAEFEESSYEEEEVSSGAEGAAFDASDSEEQEEQYHAAKADVHSRWKDKIEELRQEDRRRKIKRTLAGDDDDDDGDEPVPKRKKKGGGGKKKEKNVTVVTGPAMHKKSAWAQQPGIELSEASESSHHSDNEEEDNPVDPSDEELDSEDGDNVSGAGHRPEDVVRLRRRLLAQTSKQNNRGGKNGGGGGGGLMPLEPPRPADGMDEAPCWWCLFGDLSHDKVDAEAIKVFITIYETYVSSMPLSQLAYLLYGAWNKLIWIPSLRDGEEVPTMTPQMFMIHLALHTFDPRVLVAEQIRNLRTMMNAIYENCFVDTTTYTPDGDVIEATVPHPGNIKLYVMLLKTYVFLAEKDLRKWFGYDDNTTIDVERISGFRKYIEFKVKDRKERERAHSAFSSALRSEGIQSNSGFRTIVV